MLVSAAPGWEFLDLAGRHHLGGGSHGSLERADSEVPMLTVGLGAPPASITGDQGRSSPRTSASSRPSCAPDWVERQLRRRGIRDERVLAAMARVPRELVRSRAGAREHAYDGRGARRSPHGQTISQPYIVALICQALELAGGERVLDVGTGSGYQAAVLAELAARGRLGRADPGARRAGAPRTSPPAGYDASTCASATARSASRTARPYDAIAVAAAATGDAAEPLYEQLAAGGRLVLPLGESLVSVTRTVGRAAHALPLRLPASCRSSPVCRTRTGDDRPGMRGRAAAELLSLPVRLHGIQLGRPVDALLDARVDRVLGFEVLCGDGAHRFLPFAVARRPGGRDRARLGADADRRARPRLLPPPRTPPRRARLRRPVDRRGRRVREALSAA